MECPDQTASEKPASLHTNWRDCNYKRLGETPSQNGALEQTGPTMGGWRDWGHWGGVTLYGTGIGMGTLEGVGVREDNPQFHNQEYRETG